MRDDQARKELIRLCFESLAPIDETKEHVSIIKSKTGDMIKLLEEIGKTDYRYIHPAWGIQLYLARN